MPMRSLRYENPNSEIPIVFAREPLSIFEKHRQKTVWMREAGGQLFGKVSRNRIDILIASEPKKDDKRWRYFFAPNRKGEQNEIDQYFEKGLLYLGDWHTHPQSIPRPSKIDLKSIRQCYELSEHNLDYFILVIVGLAKFPNGLFVAQNNSSTTVTLLPNPI